MANMDPAYILPTEHRPKLSAIVQADEIPVIDLSQSNQENIISEIGKACEEWGFFQVINHGVPFDLITKVAGEAKNFFELSLEEKKKVRRDAVNAMGFYDSEYTKNIRDWKEIFDFLVEDGTPFPSSHEPNDLELRTLNNQWPLYPTYFRETMEEYARELEKLSYRLLELISLSLGLASDKFHECFKNQLSIVRLNYYPPCPFPDLALGVGRHTDSSALTVLAQDNIGGLQVKRKSVGDWVNVKPISGAFVINLGDVFQVWSNDKYNCVEHRALGNSEKERFSYPFFLYPGHHVMVKPAKELVNEQDPAKYKAYNVGKFYATRILSDFDKQEVENIQFHHFKIMD